MKVSKATFKKGTARVVACVMAASSVLFCFVGCESPNAGNVDMLNELADSLALMMMGGDAFNWNALSADPEGSFGVTRGEDNTWYSYGGKLGDGDILSARLAFNGLQNDFEDFREDRFSGVDAVTYRSLGFMLESYCDYYNSRYAADFSLFGGGYINAEGGYVADFASSFENFIFRDETDVKTLLAVTEDTNRAFATYVDYARDRASSGFPLYDYSITSMQTYLNDVYEQGEEYYLYELAENKINGAEFLSEGKKASYKTLYNEALTDKFMRGVKSLSDGLGSYKGNLTGTDKSYLAQYGKAGKAYYEIMFGMRTGIFGANIQSVYSELQSAYSSYAEKLEDVSARVEALKDVEETVYNDFNAYVKGEKVLLGLTDPEKILEYLKDAAKHIVPDLETTHEIDFKYMDDTVAQITSTVAYYVKSPVDETGSAEHITLNPVQAVEKPADLLTTIAHEGYPGHLYAHVKSKETGTRLISTTNSCITFSEGWAQYVELALLDHIAATTEDKAVKLYAEYDKYDILTNYINNVLMDMMINYMGYGVTDLTALGLPRDAALFYVEYFMEHPVLFVPYGYGIYYLYELHNDARSALGDKYDEISFNDALLSEGFGPTLPRAGQIARNYIAANK